jgi:hypothetical protein
MTVSCYLQGTSKGDCIVRYFAQGCAGTLANTTDYIQTRQLPSGPVFLWGCLRGSDLILKQCLATGHEFYYADNCYYGNVDLLRITRNGLQNTKFIERPRDRFHYNPIKINSWRRNGSHIVMLPPTESFAQLFGKQTWVQDTVNELKRHTDREIIVRHKPNETSVRWENGYMVNAGAITRRDATTRSLQQDLSNAWAVVAFQSSAVWEAIAQGIPAFVDPMNAASVLGNTDLSKIETPVYPDQEQYFRHINYCQFTRAEIASGFAWQILSTAV